MVLTDVFFAGLHANSFFFRGGGNIGPPGLIDLISEKFSIKPVSAGVEQKSDGFMPLITGRPVLDIHKKELLGNRQCQ